MKTNMIRIRDCQELKEWEGDVFQLVITKTERSSEDAGGKLLPFARYIFSVNSYLTQAPLPKLP